LLRLTSIRTRVLLLGVVSATLVVGAILISTYVVVVDGMDSVASAETSRLANRATSEVRHAVTTAIVDSRRAGLSADEAVSVAELAFSNAIPEQFGVAQGFLEGHFAFWDPTQTEPQYVSDSAAVVDDPAGRAKALQNSESVETHLGGRATVLNVLLPPDLGTYVVHVPFERPNGHVWVLDVVYEPTRETASIERIRPPMLVLSALAVFVTVLVLLRITNWVLRLVDELRLAADSIDAGLLNLNLPENEDNEVGDLARSLNALIGRLRRKAEAQTRFVADASHELATPVAGIRGYVSIMRGWGADDPDVMKESLSAIDRESRRMMRLTRQLLALIRSEHELEFHSVRHDVNAVIRQVLAAAATRYSDKELVFEGPVDSELILHSDPDRIEEVISILVDNAAKYTQTGGRVRVETAARKADIVIRVSDTGPGIDPSDLPNIFERFYRSDSSRASSEAGGFGLGLAIAKQIVESAGGLIDVSSQVGVGTTFSVRVPRGRI
jgi:signal transduction histidine kinase